MLDPQMLSTLLIGVFIAVGTLATRFSDSNRKTRSALKKLRAVALGYEGHMYECHREITRLGGTIPPLPPGLEGADDDE